MPKIVTDKKKVNEVLVRGVEMIYPSRSELEKVLLSGKRIRLYCGFDPSASALHIGNAIAINKLAQFQALGHEVIFLIGDFTGMIGDPTDKKAARKKMTREQVRANSKNFQKQASIYLKFSGDNPAITKYNSEWSDKLTFKDLIEITSNFTVQQMIQRDMFQERLKEEKPIFLHEFLYPVAQGYDSVAMDVDLEVGGNDQMFNMMCGRDLIKATKGKDKFVLTMKLLADDTGKKMGKSEGNVVNLDAAPADMYGQIMAWPDGVIAIAFELCTKLSLDEVDKIKKELKDGNTNPRDLKMKLAYEITRLVHGEDKASQAQELFIKTFQKKETPDEVKEIIVAKSEMNIVDLLVAIKLAASNSDARRLIGQKGIKVDDKVIMSTNETIRIKAEGTLIQRGKRQFIRVKFT
jgi:tyrosyl-tRNA synthetase